ncbi:peroxiredoxin [Achromobacter sp. GG226]|uniref:peroxiredoxin n=1 Tax=Verticiella alkaliphila TaxID=2779529 RepID=UPI001C0CC9BE|nr:peroxiredoxin [Verticiella sp. GG226]MBU4609468.1 peroxiredoxin [Verticiella sp. GG226]
MTPWHPASAVVIAVAAVVTPAHAALPVGAPAPDFSTQAALAGDVFEFSLAKALAQGPVVLYFYPAAFTAGCTIEAHSFAEAADDFRALGATVIGMSNDTIDTLKSFSVSACGGKFAVGSDPRGEIIRAYDASAGTQRNHANRISYVISPEGRVLYEYTSGNPHQHVDNTMQAVRDWAKR